MARASLHYAYDRRTVWLEDLGPGPIVPGAWPLCAAHAERLSVPGGWTLVDAEHVCTGAGIEKPDTIGLLTSLVDKNLVITEEHHGITRYRMLETIRQYALISVRGQTSLGLARPMLRGPWLRSL